MTLSWFDALVVAVFLAYAILGYQSGIIRRVIGFAALYGGLYAAQYTGHAAVPLLKQGNNLLETADARIYIYFGTLLVIVVLIELIATLYHQELQVSLVALNHLSGLAAGLFTALAATVMIYIVLGAAGNPLGGSLTSTQVRIRDQVQQSLLGPKLVSATGNFFETTFRPVLPHDLSTYFGGAGIGASGQATFRVVGRTGRLS